MAKSIVFNRKRTQAVRLSAEMCFPDSVKTGDIRIAGQERIISPAASAWDSFFPAGNMASEDFMAERAGQQSTQGRKPRQFWQLEKNRGGMQEFPLPSGWPTHRRLIAWRYPEELR
jgi:antitoxin VapB